MTTYDLYALVAIGSEVQVEGPPRFRRRTKRGPACRTSREQLREPSFVYRYHPVPRRKTSRRGRVRLKEKAVMSWRARERKRKERAARNRDRMASRRTASNGTYWLTPVHPEDVLCQVWRHPQHRRRWSTARRPGSLCAWLVLPTASSIARRCGGSVLVVSCPLLTVRQAASLVRAQRRSHRDTSVRDGEIPRVRSSAPHRPPPRALAATASSSQRSFSVWPKWPRTSRQVTSRCLTSAASVCQRSAFFNFAGLPFLEARAHPRRSQPTIQPSVNGCST